MRNDSSTIAENTFFWLLKSTEIQQDTTHRPTSKDSADAKVFGVDPIFIMNERRTKEIEEFKVKQQRIAAWRAKQALIPKVDTTCYICPEGESFEIHQIVTSGGKAINAFNLLESKLYDENLFLATKPAPKGLVFIETDQEFIKREVTVKEEYRQERLTPQADWIFFPLFGLFMMLAVLKVFYHRFLNYFLQGSLYMLVASKIHQENSLLGQRIIFILDSIYFISTSIFVVLALDNLKIPLDYDFSAEVIFVLVLATLLAFRFLRYLFITISKNLSQTTKDLNELFFHQLIFSRVFGLFLVPLLLIFAYSKGIFVQASLYLIITIVAITIIMRTLRTIRVFIHKGFSIFYFLLYLCALEIAPVLVFIKEFFWE